MLPPTWYRRFIGLVAVFVVSSTVRAELRLDAHFDHGSLRSWSVDANDINLIGRDNFFGGGQWRWLYFQATGVDGRRLTFEISSNFAGGAQRLADHRMVYSYDNEAWFFFDQNELSASSYQFANDSAFTQDSVWIAYALPYAYERTIRHTRSVLATSWARPTDTADSQGVIGQSPGGTDDLGRQIESRDLFGYRISNPATDRPDRAKRKVVLAAGLHAGETLGNHTLEGLVDWLVSNDSRAARLRDVAEFFVYPMLNPDGRFAGYNRSTVENVDQDPNRIWSRFLWQGHQEIEVSGEAMIADVRATPGNRVDAFIDFHSTIPTNLADDFGYLEFEQNDHQADFWRELRRLQPNIRETDSTSTTWTTANFAESYLRADVDITFETQFGTERPLSYYRQLGANFGIAFHNVWVPEPSGLVLFLAGCLLLGRRRVP